MPSIKEAVLEVIENLSDQCTWDEVMYRLYVRRKIEEGTRAIENGEVVSHDEVFKKFEQ